MKAREVANNRRSASTNLSLLILSLKPFMGFVKTASESSPGTLPTWALEKAKDFLDKLNSAQKASSACMRGKDVEVPDPSDVKHDVSAAQTLQKTMADLLRAAGNRT